MFGDMERVEHRTGQLYFIDGKFLEKVRIGINEWSYYDEELQDVTEEIINCICDNLKNRGL